LLALADHRSSPLIFSETQLADTAADDALKAFSIGDRVKAKVLDIDTGKNRIAFGLKPSYFTAADFGEVAPATAQNEGSDQVDSNDEGASEDEEDEDADMREALGDSDEDDDDEEEVDDDNESTDGDFVEAEGFQQSAESSQKPSKPKMAATSGPRLELSGGFSWSANGADGADTSGESDNDDDDDSNDEERAPRKSSSKKGKEKKGNLATEDITADLATKVPESSTDFERILLGSPDSSYIWIQFMGFHLQLGDVDRAREVARQALKIIHFREEQERLNVWIALLNLENQYGSDDTLDKTFKEASAANDAKTIHLRLLQIFERTGKLEKAEDLWKKTTKKFGYSSKVWVLYAQFLLREGRADEARQLIPRSMQSLEKRKRE
jgi:rRNA biogenesis protein RRP5